MVADFWHGLNCNLYFTVLARKTQPTSRRVLKIKGAGKTVAVLSRRIRF